MNHTHLLLAIAEAERFLARARKLDAAHRQANQPGRIDPVLKLSGNRSPLPQGLYDNPKQQGAVRRASMDLTRALADLRRGDRT